MTHFIIALLSLFVFAQARAAGQTPTDAFRTRVDLAEKREGAIRMNIGSLQIRVSELDNKISTAQKVRGGGASFREWLSTQKGITPVSKQIENYQAQRRDLLTQLDQARGDLQKAVDNHADAKLAFNAMTDTKKIEDLSVQIEAAGAFRKFDSLDKKLEKMGDTLNVLEKVGDQSMVGAYLKDKMGTFVNSQLFCEGYNRCRTNDPKQVDIKFLDEVFPETPSTSRTKEEYYKKTHSNWQPGAPATAPAASGAGGGEDAVPSDK